MSDLSILDVGCGDGSIGIWVCEQLRQQGHTPHYTGVDLDEKMAEAAAQRLQDTGIDGYTTAGDAHTAPGTGYDAILAFELIEHVNDTSVFLQTLEDRLKPGGTIFISTPNGTFGLGGNPHHLRVYDLESLIDELRHRGRVTDAIAGHDGVSVVSYKPEPRQGEIAIYVGPGWERWGPADILTRGLGGSETAAVKLAEALAELGWVVTVYGDVHRCIWGQDGILFEHYSTFDREHPRAAVIASRLPELFDRPVNTPCKLLWVHDVDLGDRLTEPRAEQLTAMIGLSEWHVEHLKRAYPTFPPEKIVQARNAISPELYEHVAAWKDRPPRAVYSSSPDRGLDFLLRLWPQVRERVPDAELVCTYAPVYQAVADQQPEINRFREELQKLARQPGVSWRTGGLGQGELAQLLGSSRVWLAPSWSQPQDVPFMETYCIGAVEAAAAGCWRIGSPWGALVERGLERSIGRPTDDEEMSTGPDWMFSRPDEQAWITEIVGALIADEGRREGADLLRMPSSKANPLRNAREDALEQTWHGVAMIFTAALDPVAVG